MKTCRDSTTNLKKSKKFNISNQKKFFFFKPLHWRKNVWGILCYPGV